MEASKWSLHPQEFLSSFARANRAVFLHYQGYLIQISTLLISNVESRGKLDEEIASAGGIHDFALPMSMSWTDIVQPQLC